MEHYEILAIIPGSKTDDEAQQTAEQLHQLLRDRGANIVKSEFWGKRKLAYEIEKEHQGFYDLVEFDLEQPLLQAVDQALRLNEAILRHQIVRRVVKTPEQLAAELKLRERIAAKHQEQKEKEVAASIASDAAPTTAPTTEPVDQVSPEELTEKLAEILDTEKLDV